MLDRRLPSSLYWPQYEFLYACGPQTICPRARGRIISEIIFSYCEWNEVFNNFYLIFNVTFTSFCLNYILMILILIGGPCRYRQSDIV